MAKPTFEDAIAFVEAQDIQLYDCQKDMLKIMLENEKVYFFPARGRQKRDLTLETIILFNELFTKENENEYNQESN